MRIFTIGFTKTSAEGFFERLRAARVRAVVDVRLNNVSQLAGFAKKEDLRYFTRVIAGATYAHRPELAPTQELLDEYKQRGGSFCDYERKFLALMRERRVEELLRHEELDGACLLCSEAEPHHCHRRLVAEYLRDQWGTVEIAHL